MGSRANWLWLPVLAALGVVLVLVFRPSPEAPPGPRKPPPPPPSTPFVPPSVPPPAQASPDPLLRKWQLSILQHDRAGVEQASAAFRAKEEEYRDRLVALAAADPEPRIRGFTVTLLASFRKAPPEEVFVRALGDAAPQPRESAIAALSRHGTRACLEALDRAAASDPVERLRGAAAEAARSVRAK